MGAKGTIIGIRTVDENDKLYDVVFDTPFVGGLTLNCSSGRGYRLPSFAMINISYGNRVYQDKTGVPGQYFKYYYKLCIKKCVLIVGCSNTAFRNSLIYF